MPREYLERLRTIDRELNSMLDHKQEILEQATSIKSMPDGVCVQTSTSSKVENAAVRLADYGDLVYELVDDMVKRKEHALELINQIPDGRLAMLLKYRYVFCWSWNKVSAMMCYDRTSVWRMRDEAIKEFGIVWESRNTTQHENVL